MIRQLPLFALIIMFVNYGIKAQPTPKPEAPYILYKYCPFEYRCAFDSLYIMRATKGYSREGDSSSSELIINVGTRLLFNYGNMHIDRLGVAIITKPCDEFITGDSVLVLSYAGEGSFTVWHRGQIKVIEEFWPGSPDLCFVGTLLTQPVTTWWVNASSANGRTFWLKLPFDFNEGLNLENIVQMNWRF